MPDEKWKDAKRLFIIVQQMECHFKNIDANLSVATLKDLASLYHNVAQYNRIVKRCYNEAVEYSLRELQILRRIYIDDNNEHVAECLSDTGYFYWYQNDNQIALEFCQKAFKIFQRVIPGNKRRVAMVINRIGLVYESLNDSSNSLKYYTQA